MYYALVYNHSSDGTEEERMEVYVSLEDLLSDVDEFGLTKDQYDIYEFIKMDTLTILTRFTEEIGGYNENIEDFTYKDKKKQET